MRTLGDLAGSSSPSAHAASPPAEEDGKVRTLRALAEDRAPKGRRLARSGRAGQDQALVVRHSRPADPDLAELGQIVADEGLFEAVVADLNTALTLPRSVTVEIGQCDEVNAYYDPQQHRILVCLEMMAHFLGVFGAEATDDAAMEEAGTKAVAATIFIFYHELGHALVHVLDLPVVGREEDAVDQLATVMLLETWDGEESELALLATAESFDAGAAESEELATWDEHSLDEQRYFNILCWTYGSDPEYFEPLTGEDWGLPETRAVRCPGEYEQLARSWERLLGPHLVG